MALSETLLKNLSEIKQDTERFKVALRTSFIQNNTNNHVVIQDVNNQCAALKRKVKAFKDEILENDYYRAQSVLDSANLYIGKYEQIIERGLPLKGDLVVLVAKTPKEIEAMLAPESSRRLSQ